MKYRELTFKRGKEVGPQPMNENPNRKTKLVTFQPTTGGCRMKHVRTLLLLLVAGLMLSSTAWAQGDLSLGGGNDGDLSAGIVDATFSGSANAVIYLMHPYHTADYTEYTDTVKTVSKRSTGIPVFKFGIENTTGAEDTLESITIRSFNDREDMFKNIYLYRDTDSTGSGTLIAQVLDLGASTGFTENQGLPFTGLNDPIPDGAAVYYWFTADMDEDRIVDTLYNDLFAGLKVFQNDVKLASSGFAPTGPTDTLRYTAAMTNWVERGIVGNGRTLIFDTKPPELTIEFDLAADNDSCGGNGIVNLGDSIFVTAWDTVGIFEINSGTVVMTEFGGTAVQPLLDTLAVGSDSAMTLGFIIPETSITPPIDVASGFHYLLVTVEDESGNQRTDSLLLNYAIDNQQPLFDGDSVWMELVYDANGDNTAAIGDTVQVFAYMTSNAYGEVDSVSVDMSNWGYSSEIPLDDASGDRRFTATIGLTAGTLDLAADSSGSRFWVWAYDNACNWNLDSNVAHFAVDNEPPAAALTATYSRNLDLDSNNVINLGDEVIFEFDLSNTDDLIATCELYLDLFMGNLGGLQVQCVEDTLANGHYTYTHTVADGGAYGADVGANVHQIDYTLTDDAGNTGTYQTSAINFPVDTDPPERATNLTPSLGPCSIDLDWSSSNVDDSLYFIYWDGGDGWDVADSTSPVGSSTDTTWTTDGTVALTHGTTYQFIVRTIDDANNGEWNFVRVSQVADCEPPTVCIDYPATGGAYGANNEFTVIAESPDADVAGATLWVQDADQGTGTPGDWISLGAMTQVGGGQQFTKTVTNALMTAAFPAAPDDDTYNLLVTGVDDVGNVQDTMEANAACDDFGFTWFYVGLPISLIQVNDTVSPQTSCGYNVTRDANNTVEIDVTGHLTGRTYTIDVIALDSTTATRPSYRVEYFEDVSTIPFTFNLNATDWIKGTNTVYVNVIRDDGNEGWMSFDVCVPDEVAPTASIISPVDGQRVRRMNTAMNPLEVWAQVDPNAYDPAPVSRVDFEHSLTYDADYTVFDVETVPDGGIYKATWDNRAWPADVNIYLRAKFYDDKNNMAYTTPVITVVLDSTATDVMLTSQQIASINGVLTIAGTVDMYAEIVDPATNDFDSLVLYMKEATAPDLFAVYSRMGVGVPGTSTGVYVFNGINTAAFSKDEVYYDFRVIAYDITGNVMWDYDDDGAFDDYTFDYVNVNSDVRLFVDNTPADIAFKQVEAAGVTFLTPSTKLSGSGMVFAPAREDITVWAQTIPMADTFEVTRVNYGWVNPSGVKTNVGQLAPEPWYMYTFNPYDLGLYTDADVEDNHYTGCKLVVSKEDSLNRAMVVDTISITILDADANQAVLNMPWGKYLFGDVNLTAFAINGYNLRWVVYEYQVDGGADWMPIDSSAVAGSNFPVTWSTLGNVEDGWVWVRAVAVDSAFNRDADPIATKLYIANALPTATMTGPTDDEGFIGGGDMFMATAANGEIPIDSVLFMYKNVLSGSWNVWSIDYYPPYEAQWDDSVTNDGAYHFKVRAYNRAGRYADTGIMTYYHDETDPVIAATKIADQDVEANNDPALDLTGLDVIDVEGAFYDNASSYGANSGIVKVAFRVDGSGGNELYQEIDPATDGIHSTQFNISGLSSGTYSFYFMAWDAVGNQKTFGPVNGTISDQVAPVTSIVGYFGERIYGRDWSSNSDASHVLFQYRTEGGDWIGIGVGKTATGTFWYADFDVASLDDGTYDFRMLAEDGSGNIDEASALIFVGTVASGEITFDAGSITEVAAYKNYEQDDCEGVIRVEAGTVLPGVLAIYKTNDSVDYDEVDLDQYIDPNTRYHGSFYFDYVGGGGTGMFLVGVPDGMSHTSFKVWPYWSDYGTNGTVMGNDGNVEVTIPGGAGSGRLVVMETWMPRSGEQQDTWQPVGNHNGLANYIGCLDDCSMPLSKDGTGELSQSTDCCFNDNKYAVVKMAYDATVDTPAESLLVVWWDESDNEWRGDAIYYLYGDEGFDTEAHTVEFSTNCLAGIFAVVRIVDDDDTGPIKMAFENAYEYCNGYVGPHSSDSYPKFQFYVFDEYSGIDDERFRIKLNDKYITYDGSDAEFWSVHYDDVSGILSIWMVDGDGCEYDCDVADLPCGQHTLEIKAWNYQNNYRSMTWDFEVDCTPPTVVFDNYYVTKNPTISFTITDDLAGIDPEKIFVDVVAIQTSDTNANNPNQYEQLFFLGTFYPGQVGYYMNEATGEVTITTHYELEDERSIGVAIYDGTRSAFGESYDWDGADPVGSDDWDQFYLEDHGPHDCVGNAADPWFQILAVDYNGPTILADGETRTRHIDALPDLCPVMIMIQDDGSGVDADMIEVYEDGDLINMTEGDLEAGTYTYDAGTGYMHYCPTSGVVTMIVAYDETGNQAVRTWQAFGEGDYTDTGEPYNFPNPFDPSVNSYTTIVTGFEGNGITVTIYDFGGEVVRTGNASSDGLFNWNGMTDEGSRVANGVYFAYCKTADGMHKVVKIAVIEE